MAKKKDDFEDLVGIGIAARILEKSVDTVRRWGRTGRLHPVAVNGGTVSALYSRGECEQLKAEIVAAERKGPRQSKAGA